MADIAKTLAFYHADPSSLAAAVTLGYGERDFETLRRAAPGIRRLLAFDVDGRVRALDLTASPAKLIEEGKLGDLEVEDSGYSLDAYVESVQFLVNQRLSLAGTCVLVNAEASRTQPAIAGALTDLFFAGSARFVAFWGRASKVQPLEFFRVWADYLAQNDAPLHALKIYYLLKPQLDLPAIASRVAQLWLAVFCPAPIEDWVPHLAPGEKERATLRADIAESLRQQAGVAQSTLATNLAAIEKRDPALHRRLKALRPSQAHLRAFIAQVPWLVKLGGAVERDDYAEFFRLEDDRLVELNAPGDPADTHDAIATGYTQDQSAALVGSIRRYDVLLSLWANPPSGSPNQAIYVVERDIEFLYHLLGAIDLSTVLEEERIHWFVGDNALADLKEYFEVHTDRPVPRLLLRADKETAEAVELLRQG